MAPVCLRLWFLQGTTRPPVAPPGMVTEADCDHKVQRFKEVFRKKVAKFKEAINLLTGYKVRCARASTRTLFVCLPACVSCLLASVVS